MTLATLASAVGVISGTTAVGALSAKRADRPNLLLITFDTTRADRLSPYGYSQAKMPAIERLAREGTLFTRAYAPAVQTLPSHASLMTGLFPITINVVSNGQRVNKDLVTLAELLKAEGYRTGAIVATAPLMEVFGLSQGFDTYNDNFEESPFSRAFKTLLRALSDHRVNIRTTRPAHRVAARGQAWIRRAAQDAKPFFLWLHFIEPHDPYVRHPDFVRPDRTVDDGVENRYGVKEANYVNEIEFADYYLGTVLSELDRLGLTKRTLTVFTADHGESLGEHGYTGHREEVFESIIHVPLIIRMPGRVPAGQRLNTPAQLHDVTPTVLKLLDVPFNAKAFQGTDLFSLSDPKRPLFSVAAQLLTRSPIRIAMVQGTQKFVLWPESGAQALFDLQADPGELRNLLAGGAPRRSEGEIAWAEQVKAWWDANDRLRADGFRLDEAHAERLRSLGYVR